MKKFPEYVIGTLETSPQGNPGNKGKIWKLVGEEYVCDNPGTCKPRLTLQEAASDLREGFLKKTSPFITLEEAKLREKFEQNHPLNWIGRWVKK